MPSQVPLTREEEPAITCQTHTERTTPFNEHACVQQPTRMNEIIINELMHMYIRSCFNPEEEREHSKPFGSQNLRKTVRGKRTFRRPLRRNPVFPHSHCLRYQRFQQSTLPPKRTIFNREQGEWKLGTASPRRSYYKGQAIVSAGTPLSDTCRLFLGSTRAHVSWNPPGLTSKEKKVGGRRKPRNV